MDEFLEALSRYAPVPDYPSEFGARVFKIVRDNQGSRLTYLKVTGGTLRVKDLVSNRRPDLPEEQVWEEKADQLRVYSGVKFRPVEAATAGTVVAVTGLSRTKPGDGLGFEGSWAGPVLEPVLTYQVELDENGTTLLRKIESYRAGLQEIYRNLNTPVNVYELAGEEGEVLNITASQFESIWSMAHEMSGGIMGTNEFFF